MSAAFEGSGEEEVDVALLRQWIGRSETVTDTITPRLEASLRAVFDRDPGPLRDGDPASPMVHWCLAPTTVRGSELGRDGHPRRGGFLPPVPLPRRMWAGGELGFRGDFRVGDAVTRVSTIAEVAVKRGRSGPLCFITVRHVYSTARGPALEERQDIVYRGAADGVREVASTPAAAVEATWRRPWSCDPVALFRYSALTFNGHRIHYDRDYAEAVEGYPGLVVHGPLQANALLDFAIETRGSLPPSFAFRGVAPLFASKPAALFARENGGGLALWIQDGDGRTTMQASARW